MLASHHLYFVTSRCEAHSPNRFSHGWESGRWFSPRGKPSHCRRIVGNNITTFAWGNLVSTDGSPRFSGMDMTDRGRDHASWVKIVLNAETALKFGHRQSQPLYSRFAFRESSSRLDTLNAGLSLCRGGEQGSVRLSSNLVLSKLQASLFVHRK